MSISSGPGPYAALRAVLARPQREQRRMLRLTVRCEACRSSPVRIFRVRDGHLVQCDSDADVSALQADNPHLPKWSRRRAFFLEHDLQMQELVATEPLRLQVICDCVQTRPRLIDVQALADALPAPDEKTRNAPLAQFVVTDV